MQGTPLTQKFWGVVLAGVVATVVGGIILSFVQRAGMPTYAPQQSPPFQEQKPPPETMRPGPSQPAVEAPSRQRGAPPIASPSRTREQDVELTFWNTVRQQDTEQMYQQYLDRYPRGEFANLASMRIAELRKAAEDKENSNWYATVAEDTIEAYSRYLNTYPRGRFAIEARQRKTAKERAMQEAASRQPAAQQPSNSESKPRSRYRDSRSVRMPGHPN